MVFIIDGSGSIEHYGRGNFKRCLRFVQSMVRSFIISRSYVRVGIVLFSSRSKLVLRFNQNRGFNSILRVIDRIKYPGRGTRTGAALRYANSRLFSGANRRSSKVAIVMTDGGSQDSVKKPAQLLRRHGVKIFCLGIGKKYNMRQLLQMAGSQRYVFTADFRNLRSVVRAVKQKACTGKQPKAIVHYTVMGANEAGVNPVLVQPFLFIMLIHVILMLTCIFLA